MGGAGAYLGRSTPVQGLTANLPQFLLLIVVNGFVGGMVGLERAILPGLAEAEFGITSKAAALSFIASFGLAKAAANLLAGHLSERYGRKRLLVTGWIIGLPVPLVLAFAPGWSWISGANVLLGLSQGLCWSMTVNMKIDLAGPRRRGFALGLNEASGYLALAGAAYLSGEIAARFGARPEPFLLGVVFAVAGLVISLVFVKDTASYVAAESAGSRRTADVRLISLRRAFALVTWRDRRLFGVTQAGFANNLNDGMVWGLLPLFFASRGLDIKGIAVLAAAYPLVWASLQLLTGPASDRTGRAPLIVSGMLVQGAAIFLVGATQTFAPWATAMVFLGIGTAMVYPTLLAAASDFVAPADRATVLGVYRFWRDAGFIAGALIAGLIADSLGFNAAIQIVAAITAGSGVVALFALKRQPTRGLDPREAPA